MRITVEAHIQWHSQLDEIAMERIAAAFHERERSGAIYDVTIGGSLVERWLDISFEVPITIEKKGDWFVATCSVFDVVTQGETRKRAKTNCEDALVFLLESCIKRGTIVQVLQESR